MAKDMKEYNRNYYAAHKGIWKRNYAENADARRESARTYAKNKWAEDPDYRAAHTTRSIRRSKAIRHAKSLERASGKIFTVFRKISENFLDS